MFIPEFENIKRAHEKTVRHTLDYISVRGFVGVRRENISSSIGRWTVIWLGDEDACGVSIDTPYSSAQVVRHVSHALGRLPGGLDDAVESELARLVTVRAWS